MDSFLLNRSMGTTPQSEFSLAYKSELIHSLEPLPEIRFDGRVPTPYRPYKEYVPALTEEETDALDDGTPEGRAKFFAAWHERMQGFNSVPFPPPSPGPPRPSDLYAHKDGVNVLDIDRKGGRL